MIKKHVFDSKLELLYQKSNVDIDSIIVVCKAGSLDENENNRGIAHFIEHTTFKGTDKRSAIDINKEIDQTGAISNAFTSKDMTAFYIKGLKKFGEQYLDILSDMIFNSKYDEEELEKEKEVVLEEATADLDDASELAYMLFYKNSLKESDPLSHPIIGEIESIKKFKRKDIIEFREKLYHPENIIIGFSSTRSKDEVINLVDKYFNKQFINKKYEYELKEREKIRRSFKYKNNVLYKDFEQSAILIAMPWEKINSKNSSKAKIVDYILGSTSSSRLFTNLREKNGLAYSVYSYVENGKSYGNLFISILTNKEKAVKTVKCVKETLVELKEKGITDKELETNINSCEFVQLKSKMDPSSDIMFNTRKYAKTGKLQKDNYILNEFRKLKVEDINNYIKNRFDFNKVSVTYVGKQIDENLLEIFRNN